MDFLKLAEELRNYHTNPSVKLELPPRKFFLGPISEERTILSEKYLKNIENYLKRVRVERRCVRAQADLELEENRGIVTKITRALTTFGVQNKNGKFLSLEEMLFLTETNKLEINYNGIPCSIQDSYSLILNSPNFTFNKYLAFKKLLLQGYKLYKNKDLNSDLTLSANKRKHETDQEQEVPNKISKIESNSRISGIFEKIRKNSPKQLSPIKQEIKPDYTFQLNNSNKPLHLTISAAGKYNELEQNGQVSHIYALGPEHLVGFYQFINVNLPNL